MSEVIADSTSKLSNAGLKAIATYLKDMPAAKAAERPGQPDRRVVQAGQAVYLDNCSECSALRERWMPAPRAGMVRRHRANRLR